MPRCRPTLVRKCEITGRRGPDRRGCLRRRCDGGCVLMAQYLTRGSISAAMMSTMKFVTATITASRTTMPWTATKSRAFRYCDELEAEALPLEGGLGEHGAAQQQGDLQADDRDDRDERRPVGVLGHEPVLADAAGPAGLDVVLAQGADDVGADQAQEDAGGQQAEGERGQDRVRERRRRARPCCRCGSRRAVDAGRVSAQAAWPARSLVRGPSGDRQPAQPDREDQLQQQAGEEHRGRVAEDREDPQDGVRHLVAPVGGDAGRAGCRRAARRERVEGQLQGCRAVGGEHLGDRAAVGDGGAEVAGRRPGRGIRSTARGSGGRSRPSWMRSASCSGGSRPPRAAVMGSPVTRIRKNTMVTRMKMVGNDQQEPDQDVACPVPRPSIFSWTAGGRRRRSAAPRSVLSLVPKLCSAASGAGVNCWMRQ